MYLSLNHQHPFDLKTVVSINREWVHLSRGGVRVSELLIKKTERKFFHFKGSFHQKVKSDSLTREANNNVNIKYAFLVKLLAYPWRFMKTTVYTLM